MSSDPRLSQSRDGALRDGIFAAPASQRAARAFAGPGADTRAGDRATGDGRRSRPPEIAVPGFLGENRMRSFVPVVALGVSSGMAFNGFNSALGQAIACIVNGSLLILLLLGRPPSLAQWTRALPVLSLAGAGALWVALTAALHPLPDPAAPLVPDLFAAQLLAYVAGVAALLCGWLMGLHARETRHLIDWLVGLSCLCLFAGLLFREIGTQGLLDFWAVQREQRFQGLSGNVNVTAAIAGVTAILAMTRLLATLRLPGRGSRRRTVLTMLFVLAVVLALGAEIATASRLATMLTLAILAALAIAAHARNVDRRFVFQLTLAAMGLFAMLSPYEGLFAERLAETAQGWDLRVQLWSQYLRIAAGSPLHGYGFGAFPTANSLFMIDPRLAERAWTANSAHNILLQLTISGGVPYLLMMLAAALLLFVQVVRGLRRRWTSAEAGIAAALLLILMTALIDITLDVPAMVTLTLFLAGTLWGEALVPVKILVAGPQRQPRPQERPVTR